MSSKPFSSMSYGEQRSYIKRRRARGFGTVAGSPDRRETTECAGCDGDLKAQQCLRVNFSPPGRPWTQLRFCDLVCLTDFLADEEEAAGAGRIFTKRDMIDSSAVPAETATRP